MAESHEGSMGTDRMPPSGTEKNYKDKQQDLTELNGEGNRDRGRYGEDYSDEAKRKEEELKKRIEELRKRDPFIYK